MIGHITALLAAALAVAYPILVYVGLTSWSVRYVGLLIVGVAVAGVAWRLRTPAQRKNLARVLPVPVVIACSGALSAALDSATFVLMVPVIGSVGLLAVFGASLRPGAVPMIENMARLQQPELSEAELRWCRVTTIVWCVFFIQNALIALALALWAPVTWWAIYTGGVAYVLIGALIAIEFLARKWHFQKFGPGAIDRMVGRFLSRGESR